MASKRKRAKSAAGDAQYLAALDAFAAALDTFGKGDFAKARKAFEAIAGSNPDEIALTARAETYILACDDRMREAPAAPASADEFYYEGVVLLNRGELDAARERLDRALEVDPRLAKVLYSRASVHALLGDAKSAVDDLGRASELDPTVRFQAVNDPDFDGVRDEAAFIDIVEPTPSEA